jgi:hypothetical protein
MRIGHAKLRFGLLLWTLLALNVYVGRNAAVA